MLMTTLKDVASYNPCGTIWESLLKSKPSIDPNTPFPISDCMPHITLGEMLWLLGRVDGDAVRRVKITFVCDCADRVLKFFELVYPGDRTPRHAIETARLFSDLPEVVQAASVAASAASVNPFAVSTVLFKAASCAAASAASAASAVAKVDTRDTYYAGDTASLAVNAVFFAATAIATTFATSAATSIATSVATAVIAEQAWQIARLKSLLEGEV